MQDKVFSTIKCQMVIHTPETITTMAVTETPLWGLIDFQNKSHLKKNTDA